MENENCSEELKSSCIPIEENVHEKIVAIENSNIDEVFRGARLLSQEEIYSLLDIAEQGEDVGPQFLSQEEIDRLLDIAEEVDFVEETYKVNYSIIDLKNKKKIDENIFNKISFFAQIDKIFNSISNSRKKLYSIEFLRFEELYLSLPEFGFNSLINSNSKILYHLDPDITIDIIRIKKERHKYSYETDENLIDSYLKETFEILFNEFKFLTNKFNLNISENKILSTKIDKSFDNKNNMYVCFIYEIIINNKSGFFTLAVEEDYLYNLFKEEKIELDSLNIETICCEGYNIELKIKNIKKNFEIQIEEEKFKEFFINIPYKEKFSENLLLEPVLGTLNNLDIKENIIFEEMYNEPIKLKIGDNIVGEGDLVYINNNLGIKIKNLEYKKVKNSYLKLSILKIKDRYFLGKDNVLFFEVIENKLSKIKNLEDVL